MGPYTITVTMAVEQMVRTGSACGVGREDVLQTGNHQTWCHKSINSALSHAGEEISAITVDI